MIGTVKNVNNLKSSRRNMLRNKFVLLRNIFRKYFIIHQIWY